MLLRLNASSSRRRCCGSPRVPSLLWVALAASPAAADSAIPAPDLPLADFCARPACAFRLLSSEHFTICTDADVRLAEQLRDRLEATFADGIRFCRDNAISPRPIPRPLEVIFFQRPDEYHRYAAALNYESQGTLGFFHADTNRTAFFNSENDPRLADVKRRIAEAREALERRKVNRLRSLLAQYESQVNQMVVQHESAHQVLYNLGVHNAGSSNPAWLVEGLACLFEPAPVGKGAGFGTTNKFRLFDFREALRDGRARRILAPRDFDRAVENGIMVDLPTLVSDPNIWKSPGDQANNYYAQAWALAHFLQRRRKDQWPAYLQTLAARSPQRVTSSREELAEFESAFGPIDREFTRQWADYILRLKAPLVVADVHSL